jgi:biotin carboxyl carrier protein
MRGLSTFWITLGVFSCAVVLAQPQSSGQFSPNKNAIAQTAQTIPTTKRFKITLTLNSPQDLKVREGDQVREGQILADRDYDRTRLQNQRREVLSAIAKIEQTPQPIILPPPPIANLPPVSFAEEEAQVEAAELKFAQAQRTYQTALSGDPLVGGRAEIDYAEAEVKDSYRKVQLQQRKLDAVVQLKNLPPEIAVHETEKYKEQRSLWEKAQANWDFKKAQYKQVLQQRTGLVADLGNKVELARSELELAQAKYRTAKERRSNEEYQQRIEMARSQEEANKNAIASSTQKLDREYKLSQLKDQSAQIDQQIAQLTQIKSPYNGRIKRIKTESQSNNTITVSLSIVTGEGGFTVEP